MDRAADISGGDSRDDTAAAGFTVLWVESIVTVSPSAGSVDDSETEVVNELRAERGAKRARAGDTFATAPGVCARVVGVAVDDAFAVAEVVGVAVVGVAVVATAVVAVSRVAPVGADGGVDVTCGCVPTPGTPVAFGGAEPVGVAVVVAWGCGCWGRCGGGCGGGCGGCCGG